MEGSTCHIMLVLRTPDLGALWIMDLGNHSFAQIEVKIFSFKQRDNQIHCIFAKM